MEDLSLKPGETVEDLLYGRLRIIQKRPGYRFSIDAVLLAAFTHVREGERLADLGTGSGVIPLLLAFRHERLNITGLELDPHAAHMAERSVEMNGLSGRISIMEGDLRSVRALLPPESFGLAVANPPYGRLNSGRINADSGIAAARHEIRGSLDDFLAAASYLLKYKGRLSLIYPARRGADVIAGMRKVNIEPKRLRTVHPREGDGANLILVEGVKGGGVEMEVMRPLYIYDCDGNYTSEVEEMYR